MAPKNPLLLYRTMLRTTKLFADYNFRSYAQRRVRVGFETARNYTGVERDNALMEGNRHLELLKRQGTISSLYPSEMSVMENKY